MTWRQLGEYAAHTLRRRLAGGKAGDKGSGGGDKYTPCFSECVDHVVIHSGERRRLLLAEGGRPPAPAAEP